MSIAKRLDESSAAFLDALTDLKRAAKAAGNDDIAEAAQDFEDAWDDALPDGIDDLLEMAREIDGAE